MSRPAKRTEADKKDQQKAAQKRYIAKLSRVEITMPPEKKQKIQDHAEAMGESVNQFLNRAADETLQRDSEQK